MPSARVFDENLGKFRPVFMRLCDPNWEQIHKNRIEIDGFFWARVSDCKNFSIPEKKRDLQFAMQSWPSGHTVAAFAAGTFLSLYFNAKLKAFSDYHTSFWKLIVVTLPFFLACFTAMSVIIDHVSPT